MTRTQLAEQEYPHFTEAQAIEIGVPLEALNERQSMKRKAYLKGLERSWWVKLSDRKPLFYEWKVLRFIHTKALIHNNEDILKNTPEGTDKLIEWLDDPTD